MRGWRGPKPVSGESPLAHYLSQMRDSQNGSRIQPGPGYRLKEFSGGTSVELIPRGGGGLGSPGLQLFQANTLNGDVILCLPSKYNADGTLSVTGSGGAATVPVALPWELRAAQQPYPSASIYPPFTILQGAKVLQYIYAMKLGFAVTGIPGADYLLVNTGRYWSDTFVVCTNGIPQNRQMPAGPAS